MMEAEMDYANPKELLRNWGWVYFGNLVEAPLCRPVLPDRSDQPELGLSLRP